MAASHALRGGHYYDGGQLSYGGGNPLWAGFITRAAAEAHGSLLYGGGTTITMAGIAIMGAFAFTGWTAGQLHSMAGTTYVAASFSWLAGILRRLQLMHGKHGENGGG